MSAGSSTSGAEHPPEPLTVVPLTGIPEVRSGDDLGRLLRQALERASTGLRDGDVLVVSSKLISKALGLRSPAGPGGAALQREALVREHSTRVVAERLTPSGLTRIVASRAGPVLAAAGVDASNTGPGGGVLALPSDPDLAARNLYADLLTAYAPAALPRIAVLLSDTAGRPWREGQVDFALGACGLEVLHDLRGATDTDGRPLSVTARAVADEVAAAADLVKGKRTATPAALVRGLGQAVTSPRTPGARALVRAAGQDWFRLGTSEAVRAALGAPPGSAAATSVGVASAGEEPVGARLRRAIDLALLGLDRAAVPAQVQVGENHLAVAAPDPYLCGRLVARLEVALHSEDLQHWPVRRLSASEDASAPTSEEPVADG